MPPSVASETHWPVSLQAMCILAPDYWMEKYRNSLHCEHRVCHLLVWMSSLTIIIRKCGFSRKQISPNMSLDAEAKKSGFLPGLVADTLNMGESLPSLSGSFRLVNVDSDTCHQILFAKCRPVLTGRQYGLQTV